MSRMHFIGGEKGGVGKSVMSRLLAQYYIDKGKPFRVFDADRSHAAMLRYYQDFSAAVDLAKFESADAMVEPALEDGGEVIVDLPAQSLSALSTWLKDSGVLELASETGSPITLWHVMDDGSDSLRLLDALLDGFGDAADYVVVRNFGRGEDFSPFETSEIKARALELGAHFLDLPALHAPTMRKIDRIDASFWAAANNKDEQIGPCLGLLERQRVKVWLCRIYAGLDALHEGLETKPEVEPDAKITE